MRQERERVKKSERERCHRCDCLVFKLPEKSTFKQAEAWSQELHGCLSHRWEGSECLDPLVLFQAFCQGGGMEVENMEQE